MSQSNSSSPKDGHFRYVPVSTRDRRWGLYITTAGYIRVSPGDSYPPAGHPQGYSFAWENGRILQEFQLHFISRGRGVFESDQSQRRVIEAGNRFLLFPGVWHRYKPDPEAGWDEFWVGFNGVQARRLVESGFFVPHSPVFKSPPHDSLLDLFTDVIETMRREEFGYQQVGGALTSLLLARLHASKRLHSLARGGVEEVVRSCKRILADNLSRAVPLEELAASLDVNPSWLRRQFRRHTGLPLHQYHLQLRMHRAMNLLGGTSSTVREIGRQLGYPDPHYFTRSFKKKTGHTPEAWRQMSQGRLPAEIEK